MTNEATLEAQLRPSQFYSLAVGAMIGVGWIPLLGIWLAEAGAIGAALAFMFATGLILLISHAYVRLATRVPTSGAEVSYALHCFTPGVGFMVGWVLCFVYVSVASFEAISVGWILGTLLPGIEGPVLYELLGAQVRAGSLVLGCVGTAFICWLNARGALVAARAQHALNTTRLLVAACFIAVGLAFGDTANLTPWFAERDVGWRWAGVLSMFVITPLFFGGFNFAAQAIGERAPGVTPASIGRALVLAILTAGAFYILVILAAAMSLPRAELLAQPLPAAAAFRVAFDSTALGNVVLFVGLLGLVTAWNAVIFASIRVLHRLATAGLLNPVFATVDSRSGVPTFSILFVGIISGSGVLFGKGALTPIVNAAGACIAIAYLIATLAAWKLYRDAMSKLTVLVAVLVLLAALAEPFVANPTLHLPTQWLPLLVWFAFGWMAYLARPRRDVTVGWLDDLR